ncbi:molybdopterin converting factor subunit 1 [Caldalkalibacillus mannanilyticus]|uniref:molybdopterin converting factor subunit 1 n=1 Tax=Caldalkalibacillus mannanilyticus TaxID=1418 RepID=UPI000468EFB6|nr:molybdopterin converting factor subunit 1 [Caldalkalibacillus mannanilyticus]
MIKVLLFAGLAEEAGTHELEFEFLGENRMTINDIRRRIVDTYPGISHEIERAMIAVNEEFVNEELYLSDQDVVAFIPPVSGG